MPRQKTPLKLIEQAAREGWDELDLSHRDLTSIPEEIVGLNQLTTLSLTSNNLATLPQGFSKLRNLTSLSLGGNELTTLPLEITELRNLTDLNIWMNRLKHLPKEISKLSKLNTLDLDGNRLKRLPIAITKLLNLFDLNLSSLGLSHLPKQFSKLSKLSILDLSFNEFSTMPPEIFKLRNLTDLNLSFNKLTSLPIQICHLTKLTNLYLQKNQLTSLPSDIGNLTSLTRLSLRENQLTHLPPEISKLSKLDFLDLIGNSLPIPPEILANPKNVKAIFAAIAGLKTGERLNEAKMLVVGDGKVGKSSVVERLIYNTFNPKKQTTLGVEINDEMNIVQSEVKGEGEAVKLNTWDFGGQEIQHSTHQFFLTTRSLYLLVIDARKGDQIGNIEYWLKLIESFGGDSPIIVVINQMDQLKGQRELNLDRNALRAKYNIRAFVPTSCETGEGIADLKAAITREVEEMKHVRDLWPPEWIAIKRRLKDMQADYIPVEKYLEICAEEDLADPELRESLLDMLHILGTVIRFPGDTQVLNPRWVTQGVYGLLTSAQLVKSLGQFYLKDVGTILDGIAATRGRYPPHTHQRLIDVMKHFQLCFEFTDRPGHYLIPRHLHDNELDIPWDETGALKLQYHYVETLPDAIISRFLVRMNQFIAEQSYWKNGVFLHDGANRAKVKADLVDRKIFVSVIGNEQTRRAFLAVIRSALDEINSTFKIEIKQMIPVPGSPEVLVSYQDLLAHEEMNEPQIVIPELRRRFAVRELLDGVDDFGVRMDRRKRESDEKRIKDRGADQVLSGPRTLRIVVASPGDVQSERDRLPNVIEEVNRYVADRGLSLVLTRWETDAHPGFHPEGPQGLIDPILKITDCDLLIGIFWKRFGTPTADGKTGTEHEFSLAYETWQEKGHPQIFVYFNQKPYTPKSKAETEQWGQVIEFKEKFPKEGLWWAYKGKTQFEKLVRTQLMNYVRSVA